MDKWLEEIREKIACPQFGDEHYGEWGILNINQRRTIKRVLDYIDGQEKEIERLNYARTRDAQRYEQKISDQAHTNCVLIDLHSNAIKEVKELEEKLKTAKAEAYRECIARVEDRLSHRLDPELFPYIRDCLRDELAKMVGGKT